MPTTQPPPAQTTSLLSSFRLRDFRLLWLSGLGFSGGMWIQQVAVGWLVLEMTGSPLALGAVQAARMLPSLLFGMVAGVLADRLDRRWLLVTIGAVSAAYSLGLAALITSGALQLWHVLALTFVFGAGRAFEWPASQALVYDLVGPDDALKGVSLNATANRLMGVVSGFAGGAIIPLFGPQGSLVLMGCGYAMGTLLLVFIHSGGVHRPRTAAAAPSFGRALRDGYGLARTNRRVLGLFLLTVCGEIFAFSHQTLVPVFARDVLDAGAAGLGALTSARALGSVASSLVLARFAYYHDRTRLLLWHYALYGACMVAFAASTSLPMSVVLMAGVGLAASSLDILQQTLMQLAVRDEDRGRAVGYWVAALGFGPVGHLEIGSLGALAGAPLAMAANGVAVCLVFVVAALLVGRARRQAVPEREAEAAPSG